MLNSINVSDIPIYIINLPRREDRSNHMSKMLEKAGLTNYTFVTPVEAKDELVDILYDQNIIHQDNRVVNKYKASHTLTYMDLLRSIEDEHFIIMEDDLSPIKNDRNLAFRMSETINNTPDDFDIIYFEYCHEFCSFIESPSEALNKPICLGATMWNRNSARRIANSFFRERGNIDQWIGNKVYNKEIKAYGPYPPLFYQDDRFGTDLPQMFPLFIRRGLFHPSSRACVQTEVGNLLFKISMGLTVYRIGKFVFGSRSDD